MKELVRHYAGSISYGTNIETSDTDIRGIFCADKKNVLTPFYPIREQTLSEEEDGKLYEVGNYLELYTKGNPNILESLWINPKHIITKSVEYDMLAKYRQELLSSKVAFTFSGYAISQLKRIKGHNKWLNNPQPNVKPVQSSFIRMVNNFTDAKIFSKDWTISEYNEGCIMVPYGGDIYGIVPMVGSTCIDASGSIRKYPQEDIPDDIKSTPPLFVVKYLREEHVLAKDNFTNYWTWKNNRNAKRSALEQEFGIDTKHAMHLVRLLRMGEEVLRDGVVNVYREDADELLAIRNGDWTYEELLAYAEDKDKHVREVLYKKTDLPKKPDMKLATQLLLDVRESCWRNE